MRTSKRRCASRKPTRSNHPRCPIYQDFVSGWHLLGAGLFVAGFGPLYIGCVGAMDVALNLSDERFWPGVCLFVWALSWIFADYAFKEGAKGSRKGEG